MKEVYCAIDLGATSGRVIISDGSELQEIYRFPNGIYERDGMFFWDTDASEDAHRPCLRARNSSSPDHML